MDEIREKLKEACELGALPKVKDILKKYPFLLNERCIASGIPLLVYAVTYNRIEIVSYLLGLTSINVNIPEIKTGNTVLIQACIKGRTKVLPQLFSIRNININHRNLEGNTALICATQTGQVRSVELILTSQGVDINLQNNEGRTALMYACGLGHEEIIHLLLSQADIDVNRTDHNEEAAIHQACRFGREEILTMLLSLASTNLRTMIRNKDDLLPEELFPKDFSERKHICQLLEKFRAAKKESIDPASLVATLTKTSTGNAERDMNETEDSVKEIHQETWANSSSQSEQQQHNPDAKPPSIPTSSAPSLTSDFDKNHSSSLPIPPSVINQSNESSTETREDPYLYDVFLSHNWGKDSENRDNHERVKQINVALQQRGLITWFDEEKLTGGNLREAMARAIPISRKILIFLTLRYHEKIESRNSLDNCYFEFNFAMSSRRSDDVIVVVMEESVLKSHWCPRVQAEIGSLLYLKNTDDRQVAEFEKVCDAVVKEVEDAKLAIKAAAKTSTPSGSFFASAMVLAPDETSFTAYLQSVGFNQAMIKASSTIGIESLEDFQLVMQEENLFQNLKGILRLLDQHRLEKIRKEKFSLSP